MKKRVVLAFSGGLDTSYCAVYLSQQMGMDVHAALGNTGGFSASELQKIEQRANDLGCKSFINLQLAQTYYDMTIRYMVYGNMLKNGSYPISVSSERIVQAIAVANYAKEIGADYICHGSTGAGNDQVRFDMIFGIIAPEIEVIALIREQHLSREQEINYLTKHDVEMDFNKAEYSINQGLWGTSVGGKETLTSTQTLPEAAYPTKCVKSEDESYNITLSFEKGELKKVNGEGMDAVSLIKKVQHLAGEFAIGRGMHIGDTVIGIKGRVGFEAAAPIVIIKAHHTLEKHVLSKWQLFWKEQIAAFYCNNLHDGLYFDPVMKDIEAMLTESQRYVTGEVIVRLMPYRFEVIGVQSDHDLLGGKFGTYGEMNNAWSSDDVKGFSKILSNSSVIYNSVNKWER